MSKKWTHKVVKSMRGMNGEYFDYPAAMTGSEAECREYAARFSAEQPGARILVRSRRGRPGGKIVAVYRAGSCGG